LYNIFNEPLFTDIISDLKYLAKIQINALNLG